MADQENNIVYVDKGGPDVDALIQQYEETVSSIDYYFNQCRQSYSDRRNDWPGKTPDLRKNQVDAFPWKGASDQEAPIIDERIRKYVALCMNGLKRSHINAYPVGVEDVSESRSVSAFLKWMQESYIEGFNEQAELAANYFFEKGLMVTYCGWQREQHSYKQELSFEQIAQANPQIAETMLDPANDAGVIELFKQQWPDLKDKAAKKALAQLRKDGKAELPVSQQAVNRPTVMALAPDSDVFFPHYCMDTSRAPYVFWRTYLTAQELEKKATAEEWDADWVEHIIENQVGVNADLTNPTDRTSATLRRDGTDSDLITVIYGFQKLIDPDDGAEGIYCTVFSSEFSGDDGSKIPAYAKHELLNGARDYPFVVTRLSMDNKRIYDLQTMSDQLRSSQWQVKVERDSRIDRASLATSPAIHHPSGRPPPDWGPGRFIAERRQGEYHYGDIPKYDPGSQEVEQTFLEQADKLIGLSEEDPLSPVLQAHTVDKFLKHQQSVLSLCFKNFQIYGDDVMYFRVTSTPGQQKLEKGNANEEYDISIKFDSQMSDPDNIEKQIKAFREVVMMDPNGAYDMSKYAQIMGWLINPVLADSMLREEGKAEEDVTKEVTEDLTKIYSGIGVGARENGANIALKVIETYVQQPDIIQRLQNDEGFKERLETYMKQYTFQLQQQQNAQIGRIGTEPADFQGTNVQ